MRWYSILSCCATAILYFLYRQETALTVPPSNTSVNCIVQRIVDGDTLIAKCDATVWRVRLANIDAPELDQKPYGDLTKEALSRLILNQSVTLNTLGADRYQRLLAEVYFKDINISEQLVKRGLAVVYIRYNPPKNLIIAQNQAKHAKLGVWAQKGLQRDPSYYRRIR